MSVGYNFIKTNVSLNILKNEINDSSDILQDVLYINFCTPDLSIFFDAELNNDEQTALQTIIDNHVGGNGQFYKDIHLVEEFSGGRKISQSWYETDNGDGTYSGLAKKIEYTWSGNKLLKEDEYIYCTNEAIWNKTTYEYYTDGDKIIKKIV
jgi:hypothetical protein